jgi:phosphatidylglycerophosphatase A
MKIGLPDLELLQKLDFKNPATWVATWFGCGLMHPAPGTWGTLGALPIGMILMVFGGKVALALGLLIIIPLGLWAIEKFEAMTGEHDSSIIVIDEAAGLWITLAAASMEPLSILGAFLLFRFFDILKPWPVSYFDRMPGAKGVMLDDIMAGIYAALSLMGITYALAG